MQHFRPLLCTRPPEPCRSILNRLLSLYRRPPSQRLSYRFPQPLGPTTAISLFPLRRIPSNNSFDIKKQPPYTNVPVYGSRFPLAPVSACYSSVYEGKFAKNTKFKKFAALSARAAIVRYCASFLPCESFLTEVWCSSPASRAMMFLRCANQVRKQSSSNSRKIATTKPLSISP